MFLICDKVSERHKKIRSFLKKGDYSIAVILAAVDFEWTVRRAIRALGKQPSGILKEEINKSKERGCAGYKNLWKKHVCDDVEKSLVKIIGRRNWDRLIAAFSHRNDLVHGYEGSPNPVQATNSVDSLIMASEIINKLTESLKFPIYGKPIRRKKERVKLK